MRMIKKTKDNDSNNKQKKTTIGDGSDDDGDFDIQHNWYSPAMMDDSKTGTTMKSNDDGNTETFNAKTA